MFFKTITTLWVGVATATVGAADSGKSGASGRAGGVYQRIVDEYMDGKWDDLEKDLRLPPRELGALTAAQKADVAYVRQATAESCPLWWKQCKAGQKIMIQPSIFGRPIHATYDPAGKGSMQISNIGPQQVIVLSWNPADMDSTAAGEYGFLKGDLTNLGVWHTLGTVRALQSVPQAAAVNMGEQAQLRMNLYLDFWGNMAGMYYSGPPARRWALHIYLAAYMEKYGHGPIGASRRAAAALLLTEILQSPSKYPSLKLPEKLAAESAEEKLAVHFKFKIGRKTHWTIAEDKAFRQAVKDFAAANERQVFESGKVKLPNGLLFALDADDDKPLVAKRDAWIKAQFDKAAK